MAVRRGQTMCRSAADALERVYQAAAQIGASVGLTQRTKVRFRRPP